MTKLTRRDFIKQVSAGGIAMATSGIAIPTMAQEALKVGIVYVSPVAEVGWTRSHDLARQAMEAAFPGKIKTSVVANVAQMTDAERVFRDLVRQGNKLIFGTSFSQQTPIHKAAQTAPSVFFEHCSGIRQAKNVGTFEARYYEGTYLSGVVAGKMSKSNTIAFIGGFPVPDVVGAANALMLGARSVNPKVVCKTIWLNSWYDPGRERDAAKTLVAQGADVIVSMTDTPTTVQVGEELNAWTIGYASDMSKYGPKKHLTSFLVDWSSHYIAAANDVFAGKWTSRHQWDGLKAGVVKMAPYNPAIPQDVIALVNERQQAITNGSLHPFTGPISDQTGKLRVPKGSVIPDAELKAINWLVEGMTGLG
ncbi:BMP family ABC transporter substrate-binding protein [Herbaspirillum sp. GCM10030257]|uniref:BMP family ABC transporter substrate-binding protein n=1 Tax=Herbaspirillum sp. GCM10030257 TaxID=3273393 RepID=UPI0036D28F1A